eukprot:m.209085 g.209085  ORF g.209085 m.209085 type:complete len:711 (+) comp24392_c0_seq1:125-2257(+)
MPERAGKIFLRPWADSLVRSVLLRSNSGHPIIQDLVKQGWDVNRPSVAVIDGETIVMHAVVIACIENCEKAVDVLIASGADLSIESKVPCEEGMSPRAADPTLVLTPLMAAVYFCKHGIVSRLLTANADPNQGTVTGTPLSLAAWRRDAETVRLLIEASVNVDGRVSDGITALHMVVESGHMDSVRQLLAASANVDAVSAASDRKGRQRTALWIATKAADKDMVRTLLDHQADANIRSGTNATTPLLEACLQESVDMVKLLLECRGDVNTAGHDGMSPLIAVCKVGNIELVRMLLDAGAEVNHRAANGATALYMCCAHNHLEAAKIVQAAGADLSLGTSNDGATPLFVACARGNVEVVRWLMSVGADVNAMTTTAAGVSPLYVASHLGRADVVDILLSNRDCKVDLASLDNGRTPLYTACAEGHTSIVRSLLRADASVNLANANDKTPLHKACESGRYDIVALLIKGSAEVNAVTDDYRTPLSEAVSHSHRRCVSLLVRHGASLTQPAQSGMMLQPLGLAVAQGKLSIAQDLAAFGAPVTPDVVARPLDPAISQWLGKVINWTAPQRALHTCRPDILQYLLQCTDANPAVVPRGTPTAFELMREIEEKLPTMDADIRGAARETLALTVAVLKGWTPATHWLFPSHFQRTVHTVILVAHRLNATAPVTKKPALPLELWELILNFVRRTRSSRPRRPSAFAQPTSRAIFGHK